MSNRLINSEFELAGGLVRKAEKESEEEMYQQPVI
jgi:hypothetical protein